MSWGGKKRTSVVSKLTQTQGLQLTRKKSTYGRRLPGERKLDGIGGTGGGGGSWESAKLREGKENGGKQAQGGVPGKTFTTCLNPSPAVTIIVREREERERRVPAKKRAQRETFTVVSGKSGTSGHRALKVGAPSSDAEKG